jgi:hypothetical protein
MQENMDVLLAPAAAWNNDPDYREAESSRHDGANGQALLREALKPDPEFGLRMNTSIALWVTALAASCLSQWGPSGVKLSRTWFIYSAIAERRRRALTFTPPEQLGIDRSIVANVGYSIWSDNMSIEGLSRPSNPRSSRTRSSTTPYRRAALA